MPSSAHQWLLTWAVRKMRADGFSICGHDGALPAQDFWPEVRASVTIGGYRPDAWGFVGLNRLVGFAEAKSPSDIDTLHTRQQLSLFGRCRMRSNDTPCPLYLAVPRSSAYDLDRVLVDTGLIAAKHIIRIHIPDILLVESTYVARQPSVGSVATSSRWN